MREETISQGSLLPAGCRLPLLASIHLSQCSRGSDNTTRARSACGCHSQLSYRRDSRGIRRAGRSGGRGFLQAIQFSCFLGFSFARRASAPSCAMFGGSLISRSHFETASKDTSSAAARSACVSPRRLRAALSCLEKVISAAERKRLNAHLANTIDWPARHPEKRHFITLHGGASELRFSGAIHTVSNRLAAINFKPNDFRQSGLPAAVAKRRESELIPRILISVSFVVMCGDSSFLRMKARTIFVFFTGMFGDAKQNACHGAQIRLLL